MKTYLTTVLSFALGGLVALSLCLTFQIGPQKEPKVRQFVVLVTPQGVAFGECTERPELPADIVRALNEDQSQSKGRGQLPDPRIDSQGNLVIPDNGKPKTNL